MLTHFISFILDEWIWNMTWGWHQLMYGAFCTALLFKFFGKIRFVYAFFITLVSYSVTFIVYTLFVVGISMWNVAGHPSGYTLSATSALIGLGGIYSCLQTAVVYGMKRWHMIDLWMIVGIMVVSNGLGAAVAYSFLKITSIGMVL